MEYSLALKYGNMDFEKKRKDEVCTVLYFVQYSNC